MESHNRNPIREINYHKVDEGERERVRDFKLNDLRNKRDNYYN